MLESCLVLMALVMHPYHVSVAEAQWDAEGTRLQVALRLSPSDLDAALSHANQRRVVLENENPERVRELVEGYLSETIFLDFQPRRWKQAGLSGKANEEITERKQRFHWVGIQDELRYIWVYFELDSPKSSKEKGLAVDSGPEEKLWLHNRVFFETEATQINTLQLLKTDPPVALRTTREEPCKPFPARG